ncbi:DUF1853 family protein [Vibrio sp. HN007]|uniref:DUF1853 family protein n=1 Tax=Vibrio iocasae TaxID=3098914 RepID=UPI0035D50A17
MTTDSLTQITEWITKQPSLIVPELEPATANPFSGMKTNKMAEYTGSPRLGFVYQELCKRLFEQHSEFELIADEVQIRDGKETLGAIDFLLQRNEVVEHWEVALKFYLLKGGYWYGPDSRDRLDIKLARMLNHQLKITETYAFKSMFPDVALTIPKLLIQGRLYHNPFNHEPIPDFCLNHRLNNAVLTGFWCYQHQVEKIKEPLYKLEKIDWITGSPKLKEQLSSFSDRSVHCQSESGDFWIIVPESWPKAL